MADVNFTVDGTRLNAPKNLLLMSTSHYPEEGRLEMMREYLVVYEHGKQNWSAFSPDIPGCGSLGDGLEDTRANLREAIELYLNETAKAGEPIPESLAASVDFSEFDPGHQTRQYVVEWLPVSIPQLQSPNTTQAA